VAFTPASTAVGQEQLYGVRGGQKLHDELEERLSNNTATPPPDRHTHRPPHPSRDGRERKFIRHCEEAKAEYQSLTPQPDDGGGGKSRCQLVCPATPSPGNRTFQALRIAHLHRSYHLSSRCQQYKPDTYYYRLQSYKRMYR